MLGNLWWRASGYHDRVERSYGRKLGTNALEITVTTVAGWDIPQTYADFLMGDSEFSPRIYGLKLSDQASGEGLERILAGITNRVQARRRVGTERVRWKGNKKDMGS